MKRKIKLKDITAEQWDKNRISFCKLTSIGCCDNCPFEWIGGSCGDSILRSSWINHKDCYSDKILDQEVEINIPDILDEKEKEYLSAVIKPFKNRINYIKKNKFNDKYFIFISIKSDFTMNQIEHIDLPFFQNDIYRGMEVGKEYTLADLGISQENTKITLTEFWNSKEKLVIHCDTEEKANKLLRAFNKMGEKWASGHSYLKNIWWSPYGEKTCYSNKHDFSPFSFYKENDYKFYEFEDVDLNN